MPASRRILVILVLNVLLLCAAAFASAQETPEELTPGLPVIGQFTTSQEIMRYSYTLAQPSTVSFQVLSGSVMPSLTIWLDGRIVAAQPNAEAQTAITLTVTLAAGVYTVDVGALNDSTGTIITLVQSEIPLVVSELVPGSAVTGQVSAETPAALFSLTGLDEPGYLYIDGGLPGQGVSMRLLSVGADTLIASLDASITGARLTIPAGGVQYQLEITHSGAAAESFRVCFGPVSADACAGAVPVPAQTAEASSAVCVATPMFAGGANIRQSATTSAPVVIALPGNATADVLGISPDGTWYYVSYNGVVGWASLAAVSGSGDCAGLSVTNPPMVQAVPTAVPPTQAAPPAPSQPTMPPPPPPSGPCLVTFTAPEFVYTRPEALVDYLQDQVSAGGQLILVGRWAADPSWYVTNGNIWWLNAMGTAGVLTGACDSLPLVTPS